MSFVFSKDNLNLSLRAIAKYPAEKKRSAILELLHLAQEQNGFISNDVVLYIAEILDIKAIEVEEIVSFYSMFFNKKTGKYVIQTLILQSIFHYQGDS